ncbi:MAG: hypothetical protein AB1813_17185 [Verrucomicrobiota bacterium]
MRFWPMFLLLFPLAAHTAELVPDFTLMDVNTQSDRKGGAVSPRNYLLQVAGFYFGQAH